MDSDSKLDLDDVAAGHPVALRELAELRGRCGKLAMFAEHDRDCEDDGEDGCNCGLSALLPAPGVAQEPDHPAPEPPPTLLSQMPPIDICGDEDAADFVARTRRGEDPPAPESGGFEEWHGRECPFVKDDIRCGGSHFVPCVGGEYRWPTDKTAKHYPAFHNRTCREVFQSEVAAKSGEGREAR